MKDLFKFIIQLTILIITVPVIILGFLYQFYRAAFLVGKDMAKALGDWMLE